MARRHRMRGIGTDAWIDTKVACSSEAREKLRLIARELVKTRCRERMVECVEDRHVIVASCPTSGAARRYEDLVGRHVKVWKAATGR